jgi:hypothetical protein
MPKLTRPMFTDAVAGLWNVALRNFDRDHTVHGTLVALDAMSRQRFFMHAPENDPLVLKKGFVPVPGPWHEHLPLLEREFKAHKAVAGILIGEAWTGQQEVARDMLRMNIAPHEHPLKDEIVFVVGCYPREFLTTGFQAVITRDEKGENPQLAEARPMVESGGIVVMATWLVDLLPRPH